MNNKFNVWNVYRVNNKVNLSGEQTGKFFNRIATVHFDNMIRTIRTSKDGREYFKFDNMTWYIDELEEIGVEYVIAE